MDGIMKKFSDLLSAVPQNVTLSGDSEITAPVVESDAEVQPGGVFVARAGLSVDGHDFIPRAIERGAAAIVGEREVAGLPVPYARVENAMEAVGYLAAAYQDFPSRKLTVIGVTGTDGKTTTSTLIHSVMQRLSRGKAGLISTIAADLGGQTVETGLHVTTPGAPQVQALLAQMVANGLRYAVIEMTSHGLAQGRLNGIDLDIAVLTNITHEHLDYHKTFENYRAAKGRMFAMLDTSYRKEGQPKVSVINGDDPNADFFAAFPADQVIRYGIHNPNLDYRAVDIIYKPDATTFNVEYLKRGELTRSEPFYTHLVGEFNVLNCLAAIEVGFIFGLASGNIYEGIEQIKAISGRMERIVAGQPFLALVDFAHTPNALRNALTAARKMTGEGGRVIAVFGSAGLRDREKRRMMAEVAAELADFTILTAEDPRTESLDAILDEMARGAVGKGGIEGQTFIRVPDRGEAQYQACQQAKAGDVVIACGKGHEQSMAFGTVEYPWDDREGLRAALRGAPLRTLPTAKPHP
jgi:UDP-N-acetylmuramoyl-L-alanyl-D-glutamate--2,6-diaminopimelate ligase